MQEEIKNTLMKLFEKHSQTNVVSDTRYLTEQDFRFLICDKSFPLDAGVIVQLADVKEEFAERFVPKIIRGKTVQYDWDDQDLENWEWFEKILKSKLSE